MSASKVKLEICGSSYMVSTNDPEDYLLGLAERLDNDMNQIMLNTPNASVTAAAVMTALAYLDEAEKSAFRADNMRAQIQGYLEDAAKARAQAEETRRELQNLKNEIQYGVNDTVRNAKKQDSLLNYGQKSVLKRDAKPAISVQKQELDGQMELDGKTDGK